MVDDLIYLDYQASTPIDGSVLELMMDVGVNCIGNPHSAEHGFGWEAHDIIETARIRVQKLFGAGRSRDIIFTSGATESNNLAIKGAAFANRDLGRKRILVNPLEHKCALESAKRLVSFGYEVEFLPIGSSGVIDVGDVASAIGDDVFMVILQAVNNELGTVQPLGAVSELCLAHGVLLHCDAAQAPTRLGLNVSLLRGISSMSLSSHKLYGPKGVGALYLRSDPSFALESLFDGGGQERGFRSGTLSPFLLAGFGLACELASERLADDIEHAESLRDIFLHELEDGGVRFSINGSMVDRVAVNLNINFLDIGGGDFFDRVLGIAVSSGSACSSGDSKSFSHVLQAIGIKASDGTAHVRISSGRGTSADEMKFAARAIAALC